MGLSGVAPYGIGDMPLLSSFPLIAPWPHVGRDIGFSVRQNGGIRGIADIVTWLLLCLFRSRGR